MLLARHSTPPIEFQSKPNIYPDHHVNNCKLPTMGCKKFYLGAATNDFLMNFQDTTCQSDWDLIAIKWKLTVKV